MGAYEARVEQQNKVGGPKPGEQNKYTQATVFLSSAGRNRSIVSQHFHFTTVIKPTCFKRAGGQRQLGSFHGVNHGQNWRDEKACPGTEDPVCGSSRWTVSGII